MEARAVPRAVKRQVMTASGMNTVAGLWLTISVWPIPVTGAMAASNTIGGLVVAVLAAMRTFGLWGRPGLSWANVVIGIWVLLSPWLLLSVYAEAAWNAWATGLIIAVLAAWSALATRSAPSEGPRPRG